jgi:hypothetical protein
MSLKKRGTLPGSGDEQPRKEKAKQSDIQVQEPSASHDEIFTSNAALTSQMKTPALLTMTPSNTTKNCHILGQLVLPYPSTCSLSAERVRMIEALLPSLQALDARI